MERVSLPELENFLMTFAIGITGLESYRDFAIISPELKSFLKYCQQVEVNSVDSLFSELEEERFNRVKELYKGVISSFRGINPNEIKIGKRRLEDLLSKMKEIYGIAYEFYDKRR